jgi:SNF2 family DNA or RNA helicase
MNWLIYLVVLIQVRYTNAFTLEFIMFDRYCVLFVISDEPGAVTTCPICSDVIERPMKASCEHQFCSECITSSLDKADEDETPFPCPTCQEPIETKGLVRLYANDDTKAVKTKKKKSKKDDSDSDYSDDDEDSKTSSDSEVVEPSTKMRFLLEELAKIKKADPKSKSIVFSQWTSMLDILEPSLIQAGYGVARLDGSRSAAQQAKAMATFNTSSKCNVFLISLKAGGVGLNLTAANNAFILDIWWNRMSFTFLSSCISITDSANVVVCYIIATIEQQACDRVYRVGQTKPVSIHHCVVKNSIEEGILALQEKKKKLANEALELSGKSKGGKATKATALSMEELMDLFA